MLIKAFVFSQFSYCPLIWMLYSRKMEYRINSIHKRALKLAYQDSHDICSKNCWLWTNQLVFTAQSCTFDHCPCRRNMLRKQDSFEPFHRFSTFGFVNFFFDLLHIIFLSITSYGDITSYSDIFSRNQTTGVSFNYQRFSILHIHAYIF